MKIASLRYDTQATVIVFDPHDKWLTAEQICSVESHTYICIPCHAELTLTLTHDNGCVQFILPAIFVEVYLSSTCLLCPVEAGTIDLVWLRTYWQKFFLHRFSGSAGTTVT
jgi:hypothetical protein